MKLNGYLSLEGASSTTMAVGRWILYEYNRWLVSATAGECVVSEKHLTQFFWQIWSLDPTRPDPGVNPTRVHCPALPQTE